MSPLAASVFNPPARANSLIRLPWFEDYPDTMRGIAPYDAKLAEILGAIVWYQAEPANVVDHGLAKVIWIEPY